MGFYGEILSEERSSQAVSCVDGVMMAPQPLYRGLDLERFGRFPRQYADPDDGLGPVLGHFMFYGGTIDGSSINKFKFWPD